MYVMFNRQQIFCENINAYNVTFNCSNFYINIYGVQHLNRGWATFLVKNLRFPTFEYFLKIKNKN